MASVEREVWRIRRAGSLGRLRLEREASPEPGPGEARVAVRAAGLNFADAFACLGLYSATPRGPFVPGLECAGVVDAVGPPRAGEAPRFRPGDRVMAVTRFGGYATRVVVDARQLHPLPERFGFAEGAAYPVQALTAWYGLVELGRLRVPGELRRPLPAEQSSAGPHPAWPARASGEVVLVHSAAGGVGLAALEVCASSGARVIATVGGAGKRDFLVRERGLAPGAVIVRDRRRFGAQLDAALAALGVPGLDLVLDAVMGPFFGPALERLRPEGRHVVFGAADFMAARDRPALGRLAVGWLRRPRVDPLALVSANRAVIGFNLIWLWDAIDRLPAAYAALERLVRRKPEIGARLPFARAPDALRLLQRGETVGKVVLEVE